MSLDYEFGGQSFSIESVHLHYANGSLALAATNDYCVRPINGDFRFVCTFAPQSIGDHYLRTLLRNETGSIIQDVTWSQQWSVKGTNDPNICCFMIDDISEEEFAVSLDYNEDFLTSIYPFSDSYSTENGIRLYFDSEYAPLFAIARLQFQNDLFAAGKKHCPHANKIAGIAEVGWIADKLHGSASGLAGIFQDVVLIEQHCYSGLAHEIGHTYSMPGAAVYGPAAALCLEEYWDWLGCEQSSSPGFHVGAMSQRTGTELNFMNVCGGSVFDTHPVTDELFLSDRWINSESYNYLFRKMLPMQATSWFAESPGTSGDNTLWIIG